MTLELNHRERLDVAVAEISDRLAALKGTLPQGVVPILERRVPEELTDQQGFMTLELSGSLDAVELRRLADQWLAPDLRAIPGVSEVQVVGGLLEEVQVTLEPSRLAALGLEASVARTTLADSLNPVAFGSLADGRALRPVVAAGAESISALRSLPLELSAEDGALAPFVKLRDVADLRTARISADQLSRIGGLPAVGLYLKRHSSHHLTRVAARAHALIERASPHLPPGVELNVVEDRGADVRRELVGLALRGGAGLFLVLAVLFLMLPTLRQVMAVLGAVGFTLVVSLGMTWPLGITFNILSLAGLMLVSGLLVDNAVVVAHRTLGPSTDNRPSTLAQSIGELTLPLVGGTATTAAVLWPLAYSSGYLRALFVPFCALVVISLSVSLAVALFLQPSFFSRPASRPRTTKRRSFAAWFAGFEWAVRWAGRRPKVALLLICACLGLPLSLVPERIQEPDGGFASAAQEESARRYNATLGSETFNRIRPKIEKLFGGVLTPFLRQVELGRRWGFADRPEIRVALRVPHTAATEELDLLIQQFEEIALRCPATRRVLVKISEDEASLRVLMEQGNELDLVEGLQLRQELIEQALGLAGLEVSVTGLVASGFFSGIGQASGYTVEATGPALQELLQLSEDLKTRLKRDRRVVDVDIDAARSSRLPARQVAGLTWNLEATDRAGVNPVELDRSLQLWLENRGTDLEADFGGRRLPIRLQIHPHADGGIDALMSAPQRVAGQPLRFGDLGQVERRTQPRAIERTNQQYRRWIRIYYQGPPKMARDRIESTLRAMAIPAGYRLEEQSTIFFSVETRQQFLWTLAGALAAVLLGLALIFESWRLPWLVLATIPLAGIGVALSVLIVAVPLAEGAFLGLILLVGLVVNNGILLVDRYRRFRLRRPHGSPVLLARLATRQRLHPMWTTTLTTTVGMLPMILFPEQGDFWLGLAVTVSGGLIVSTLLLPLLFLAIVGVWARP